MLVFFLETIVILIETIVMESVDIMSLLWISIDNNSCSSRIPYEVSAIWYINNILSCKMPNDNVDSNTPYFDVFICWSWPMPEEVCNIAKQHILSLAWEPIRLSYSGFPILDSLEKILKEVPCVNILPLFITTLGFKLQI